MEASGAARRQAWGRWAIAAYRLALAALVVAAIVAQFREISTRPGFDPVNFFSFFTILSNLFGLGVFAFLGVTAMQPRSPGVDLIRGAAVVYLAVTGVVYELLLSGDPAAVEATLPWVNAVLHQVMPIAIVIDWLLDPPASPLAARRAAWWLAFPLAWVTYTLVRGPLVDWYPYPFIDPRRDGGLAVAINAVVIGAGFVGVIAGVAWVGNRMRTRVDRGRL